MFGWAPTTPPRPKRPRVRYILVKVKDDGDERWGCYKYIARLDRNTMLVRNGRPVAFVRFISA